MALSDIFSSRLAGPAGRVLDAPIRALVHEILREQGYASPTEVQALRDDARDLSGRVSRAESKLSDLTRAQDATVAELKDARELLRSSQGTLTASQGTLTASQVALTAAQVALTAAQAELAEARAALAAAPVELAAASVATAAPQVALSAVAPLEAVARGSCSVPDCTGTLRSKGFCSAHYQQWRRGTLDGFVGLDGHLTIGKHTFRVSDDHAGKAAVLDGGAVKIAGKTVASK
jgi:hypothetical protein